MPHTAGRLNEHLGCQTKVSLSKLLHGLHSCSVLFDTRWASQPFAFTVGQKTAMLAVLFTRRKYCKYILFADAHGSHCSCSVGRHQRLSHQCRHCHVGGLTSRLECISLAAPHAALFVDPPPVSPVRISLPQPSFSSPRCDLSA